MPLDLNCPKCKQIFPVTEARHPVGVQCPSCDAELTAEFRKLPAPPPGEAPYELLVTVGRPAGSPPPVPSSKPMKLDDEEGKDRRGGSMMMVVVVGLGALLVTLGGLGATGYYLFTNLDVEERVSTPNRNNQNRPGPNFNQPNNTPFPNNPVDPWGNPKKVERFDLRPVGGNIPPISVPNLPSEMSVIDLQGKVGSTAIGGGGRYIVMHFPDKGQLAVFDASKGEMVSSVAAENGNIKLAAGANRAVLYAPGDILRVYELPKLNILFEATSPHRGLRSIAMGSRTNGPLMTVGTFGAIMLLDVSGNGVTEIQGSNSDMRAPTNHLRAMPDGTSFVAIDNFNTGSRMKMYREEGGQWREITTTGLAPFPGADGHYYGTGLLDRNGNGKSYSVTGGSLWFVPSTTASGYFLRVQSGRTTGAKAKSYVNVAFHKDRNVDSGVPGSPTFTDVGDAAGGGLLAFGNRLPEGLDQHLFLIPEAKLLAIMNADRNKLTLRKVELR